HRHQFSTRTGHGQSLYQERGLSRLVFTRQFRHDWMRVLFHYFPFSLFRQKMNFEPVDISEIHRIVAPTVESFLKDDGFESYSNLKWVRCHSAPIRFIFELLPWKGGMVAPRVSISLDFVPHVSGSSVKWHRTDKSAQSDLIYDVYDRMLEFPCHQGPFVIRENAPQVIPPAIEKAREFWAACSTEGQLLSAFDKIRNYYDKDLPEGRSKFRMFTPHELALAFVLARVGKVEEALRLFEQIEGRYKPIVKNKLRGLLMEAVMPNKQS
uniref:hypothetical protein n=1 Tax=Gallaecimonas pentaromativorans TaxID=584787 RepID=UPI003A91A360